ncbi:hypothetical protein FACS1894111_11670 [Clostridia bacterium]|nr:hypothetical protein FACS1894111_11670 [Clostridia bacterium]
MIQNKSNQIKKKIKQTPFLSAVLFSMVLGIGFVATNSLAATALFTNTDSENSSLTTKVDTAAATTKETEQSEQAKQPITFQSKDDTLEEAPAACIVQSDNGESIVSVTIIDN